MPITQQRMIALITAGQDYQQGLQTILDAIAYQAGLVADGRESPANALELIRVTGNLQVLLAHPQDSHLTLAIESRHFRLHRRENERHKIKRRESRGIFTHGELPSAPAALAGAPLSPAKSLAQQLTAPAQDTSGGYVPREPDEATKREIEAFLNSLPPDSPTRGTSTISSGFTSADALAAERAALGHDDFEGELDIGGE